MVSLGVVVVMVMVVVVLLFRLLWVVVLVLVVLGDVRILGSPWLVMVSLEEGGHGWLHHHGGGAALRERVVFGREVRVPAVAGIEVPMSLQ